MVTVEPEVKFVPVMAIVLFGADPVRTSTPALPVLGFRAKLVIVGAGIRTFLVEASRWKHQYLPSHSRRVLTARIAPRRDVVASGVILTSVRQLNYLAGGELFRNSSEIFPDEACYEPHWKRGAGLWSIRTLVGRSLAPRSTLVLVRLPASVDRARRSLSVGSTQRTTILLTD